MISCRYCQGFNFIAGFALLILPEESAFWCLVAFVEHIMPPHYFSGDLASARDDQLVLRKIVQLDHPDIYEALQRCVVAFDPFILFYCYS